MKNTKTKKYIPFLERLTPQQLKKFRSGMKKLKQRFQNDIKKEQRRNNENS